MKERNILQNKNKLLGLILLLIALFGGITFSSLTKKDLVKSVAQANTYTSISTAQQLADFAARINAGASTSENARLMNDIDLGEKIWTPIGYEKYYGDNYYDIDIPYKGIFDGNGYTISNLKIDTTITNIDGVGLFGKISGAKIKDFILKNVFINTNASFAAPVVGNAVGSSVISNIAVEGGVVQRESEDLPKTSYIGGVVAKADSSVIINNSYSSARLANAYYIGGILATSNITSVYNTYFIGEMENANTYSPISSKMDNVKNFYYLFKKITSSISYTYGYSTKEKESKTSLLDAEKAIKGIEIDKAFQYENSQYGNYQNNWIKPTDNDFPALRGVGNKTIAIKNGSSYSDYQGLEGASVKLNDISKSNYEMEFNISDENENKAIGSYSPYLKLSGSVSGSYKYAYAKFNSTIETRINKTSGIIDIPSNANRQGYLTVDLYESEGLFEHKVVIKNVTNPNDGGLGGDVAFYNAGAWSSELYVGDSYNSIARGNWSTKQTISSTGISIYVTKGTKVSFFAKATGSSAYHSLWVKASLTGDTSNQVDYSITFNSSGSTATSVLLLVSNLYEFKYSGEHNLGANYYGGLNISSSSIYLAVTSSQSLWTWYEKSGSVNGINTYKKPTGGFFASAEANGYVFEGWRVYAQSKYVSVSDKQSAITNPSSSDNQTMYNELTGGNTNVNHPYSSSSEHYIATPKAQPQLLNARWSLGENIVKFESYFDLGERFSTDFDIVEYSKDFIVNPTTLSDRFFKIEASDLGLQLQTMVYTSSGQMQTGLTGTLKNVKTSSYVFIDRMTNDVGIELSGVLIYNLDGSNNIYNSFAGTRAQFDMKNPDGGKNPWKNGSTWYTWIEESGRDSMTMSHINGDIGIILIYQRADVKIDIKVAPTMNISLGDLNVDFKLKYKVYEINNVDDPVNEGTLTGENAIIRNVLPGQTVIFEPPTISDYFKFSNDNVFVPNDYMGDIVNKGELAVRENWKIYIVENLEKALGIETGSSSSGVKEVNIDVPIKYKYMAANIIPAIENENGLVAFPDIFNGDTDNRPNFAIIEAENPDDDGIDPTVWGQSVYNLVANGSITIQVSNEHLYNWINNIDYVKLVIDGIETTINLNDLSFSREKNIITININKNYESSKNIIDIYFVFVKTEYTINLEVKDSSPRGNISESGEINYNGQAQITGVHFDEIYNIDVNNKDNGYYINIKENAGYYINDIGFIIESKEYPVVVGDFKWTFKMKLSNTPTQTLYAIKNNLGNKSLIMYVEFKEKPTYYLVEHYYEQEEDKYQLFGEPVEKSLDGRYVDPADVVLKNMPFYNFNGNMGNRGGDVNFVETLKDENDQYSKGITIFKLYYTKERFTVSYLPNSGSGDAPENQKGIIYQGPFETSANTFTNAGKNFVGWSTTKSGLGALNFAAEQNVVLTSELLNFVNTSNIIYLYAQWEDITITAEWKAPDATTTSNQWENNSGYTVSSTERQATSTVVYGQSFTNAGGIINAGLLAPVRKSYNFAGWWTLPDGQGDRITSSSIVNYTENQTFYAHWTIQPITIVFEPVLPEITLSYYNKNVYDTYGEADLNGENAGFPEILSGDKGFKFLGWFDGDEKVEEDTIIITSSFTKTLYARWQLEAPSIVLDTDWKNNSLTYNGSLQAAATIESKLGSTNPYIENTSAIITYEYQWYRLVDSQDVLLEGQSTNTLWVTNVNQNGKYKVRVVAKYTGLEEIETYSQYVTITMQKQRLDINVTLSNGKILKTYDGKSTAPNITASHVAIFSVAGEYDNPNVGTNKPVSFTITYESGLDPENYQVHYKDLPISNNDNSQIYSFADTTVGQIIKYDLKLTIEDTTPRATGQNYKISANNLLGDRGFLINLGHELVGYIETISNEPRVYTGKDDFSINLDIVKTVNEKQSEIDNYNIIIEGQVTITIGESDLKTILIETYAYLDKENVESIQAVNKVALEVSFGAQKISETGVYAFNGFYAQVIFLEDSNIIEISVDEGFDGIITVIGKQFEYAVSGKSTTAVAIGWEGGITSYESHATFDFSKINVQDGLNVQLIYQNFAVIKYNTRLNDVSVIQQTVYNTTEGERISHESLNVKGLKFLGWYDSTLATSKLIPTIWKGVGDFTAYAKWELEKIDVLYLLDGVEYLSDYETFYNGKEHVISSDIKNKNLSNISYNYEWIINGTASKGGEAMREQSFKNAGAYLIRLTIEAETNFDGSSVSLKESVVTSFFINIKKYIIDETYNLSLDKVFDNTINLNVNGDQFYILEMEVSENVFESLMLTAQYTTKNAGEDAQELEEIKLQDYSGFFADNFDFTELKVTGKITPKELGTININANDNQITKTYDGDILSTQIRGAFSENLISGHELIINFETLGSDAGDYFASSGIDFTSIKVFEFGKDVTTNYNYSDIIGKASILKGVVDTSLYTFASVDSFIFDGTEKFIDVNVPGGKLPPNVTGSYTWYEGTDSSNQKSANKKPIYVGVYTIVYTLTLSDINYEIVGTHPLTKTFEIKPRTITVDFGQDNVYKNEGVKTIFADDEGKMTVRNESLSQGHVLKGSISTNNSTTGDYIAPSGIDSALYVEDSDGKVITENFIILLVGKITIVHVYEINFYSNSGNGYMSPQVVERSGAYNLKSNLFIKDGYEFNSWNTNPDGTGIRFEDRHQITETLASHGGTYELYAIWEIGQSVYSVQYFLEELDGSYKAQDPEGIEIATESYMLFIRQGTIGQYKYNVEVYENIASYNNGQEPVNSFVLTQTFEGFSHSVNSNENLSGIVVPASDPSGSLIIKIYLTRNSYELAFKQNNGNLDIKIAFKYEEEVIPPANPIRAGYTFEHWQLNLQNSTTIFERPYYMPAEDFYARAVYTAHVNTAFKLELHYQNLKGVYDGSIVEPQILRGITDYLVEFKIDDENGNAILQMINPETSEIISENLFETQIIKEGFKLQKDFEGNVLSGNIFASEDPEEMLVLKLHFERNKYTFTKVFHNTKQNENKIMLHGNIVEKPTNPTYVGYTFDGWYLIYEEETKSYDQKLMNWEFEIKNDITIHAKFIPNTNTKFTLNIFQEEIDGTYPQSPNHIFNELKSTTNYSALVVEKANSGIKYFAIEIYTETGEYYSQIRVPETNFSPYGFIIDENYDLPTTQIINDGTGVINLFLTRQEFILYIDINTGGGTEDNFQLPVKFEHSVNKAQLDGYLPTRQDFTFGGWYQSTQFLLNELITFPIIVESDLNVYARWYSSLEVLVTVEYYLQVANGTELVAGYPAVAQTVETLSAQSGSFLFLEKNVDNDYLLYFYQGAEAEPKQKLLDSKNLKMQGYEYSSHELANAKLVGTQEYPTVQEGVVVKVYYTINSYDFVIDYNDNITPDSTQSVYFGQKPVEIANPIYIGYVFEGWFTDEFFEKPYTHQTFAMPAEQVVITAFWSEATDTKFVVEYYIETLNPEETEKTFDSFKVAEFQNTTNRNIKINETGTKIEVWDKNNLEKIIEHDIEILIGFTIDINNISSIKQNTVKPDGSGVLKIYLNRNIHTLTLIYGYNQDDLDFAVPSVQAQQEFLGLYYQQQKDFVNPIRQGYVFDGWFVNEARSERANVIVVDDSNYGFVMTDKSTTLFAGWIALQTEYTVNYYFENIYDFGSTLDESKTVINTASTNSNVKGEKFVFGGFTYSEENTEFDNGYVGAYAENKLVISLYYTRNIYVLNFEDLGNTSGEMASMNFKYQERKSLNNNEFVKNGHNFIGWSEFETSGKISYTNQELYTFTAERDMTLYALWEGKGFDEVRIEADSNQAYYGDQINLQIIVEHEADELMTYSYVWYRDVDGVTEKLSNTEKTLTITEIAESGLYYALVVYVLDGKTNTTLTVNKEQVEILPRNLRVVWNQGEFTYSAQHQAPKPSFEVLDNENNEVVPQNIIILPNISTQLFSELDIVERTILAGSYTAKAIVQTNPNFNVLSNNDFVYDINKLDWNVVIPAGEFKQEYNPLIKVYDFDFVTNNADTGQQVTLYLERLDKADSVGFYHLSLKEPQSNNGNYNITVNLDNSGFEIQASSKTITIDFITTVGLTKVYDGEIIDSTNNPVLNASNLKRQGSSEHITFESAVFEIVDNKADVGFYQINVTAKSIEYGTVILGSTYYFIITEKEINLNTTDLEISKIYDGSALSSIDVARLDGVIEQDISMLELPIRFTSPNAGQNITIQKPVLEGEKSSNYKLSSTFENLTGNIIPRNVKVVASNHERIYGDYYEGIAFDFEAYLESFTVQDLYDEVAQKQIFNGYLVPRFIGNMESVGNANIEIGTLQANSNYNIELYEDGVLTVTQRELTITADSWDKIYDGTTEFIGTLTIHGMVDKDLETGIVVNAVYGSKDVSESVEVLLTLSGPKHTNYKLSGTSVYGKIERAYVLAKFNYKLEELRTLATPQIGQEEIKLVLGEQIKNYAQVLPMGSAVGYKFTGWFVLVEGVEVQVTPESMVDQSIGWNLSEVEKEFYAKWEEAQVTLTVNVILRDSFNTQFLNHSQPELFEQAIVKVNGVSITSGNTFDIEFGTFANILASSNPSYALDYIFDGWFFAALQGGSNPIISDGIFEVDNQNLSIDMRNNFEIFVRFKLKSTTLKLDFNSNEKPISIENEFLAWNKEYSGVVVTSVIKEFDSGVIVELPKDVIRNGYTFLGWFASQTPADTETPLTQIEVIDEVVLYAVWQADEYTATFVANTGNEIDSGQKHFDNGHTLENEQPQFEKQMTFDEVFGALEEVTRSRYVFAGWYDNPEFNGQVYDENSVWEFNANNSFYAKWEETEFEITISVLNSTGGELEVVKSAGVINVEIVQVLDVKTYTVILKTSAILSVYAKASNGYALGVQDYSTAEFDFTKALVSENILMTVSRFAKAENIEIVFKANLNTVYVQVSDISLGNAEVSVESILIPELRNQEINDLERIVRVDETLVEVYIFTGEVIVINTIAKIGYMFNAILNISNEKLGKTDSGRVERELPLISVFEITQNQWFEISFTEQAFDFEVKVGTDITLNEFGLRYGSFGFSIIEKDGSETVIEDNQNQSIKNVITSIKTGQKLKVEIIAANGFAVVQNTELYTLDTTDELLPNPTINFDYILDNIIIIEDILFNNGITLQFERVLKTLNTYIAVQDKDGNISVVEQNSEEVATIEIAPNPDSEQNKFYFEKEIALSAMINTSKYNFVGWTQELGGRAVSNEINHNLVLEDNAEIYLVVRLNTYLLNYSYIGNGKLQIDTNQFEVEHGEDGQVVEAIASAGYSFKRWEIYNQILDEWQTDTVQLENIRQDLSVQSNLNVRAVFEANQVTITINSVLILGENDDGSFIYSQEQQEVGSFSIFEENDWFVTGNILSYTGQSVELEIKSQLGYKFNDWQLEGIAFSDKLASGNYRISGYVDNITLTGVFEAIENKVTVGFVIVEKDSNDEIDYGFGMPSLTQGGKIFVAGNKVSGLHTQKAEALIRTGADVELIATLLQGYKLNEIIVNDEIKVIIGVRNIDGSYEEMIDALAFDSLVGRLEAVIQGVNQDLIVAVYIELIKYNVNLHITEEDVRPIIMTVQSSISGVLIQNELLQPQRNGYDFNGWFTSPGGIIEFGEVINKNGTALQEWHPHMTDLYADWERKVVRINIAYQPGSSAFLGSIEYSLDNLVVEKSNSYNEFYYYIGNETEVTEVIFTAPTGKTGYQFYGWVEGAKPISYDNDYVMIFDKNQSELEINLKIIYSVEIYVAGTQYGEGFVNGETSVMLIEGEKAQLSVQENPGYEFEKWTLNDVFFSSEPSVEIPYQTIRSSVKATFTGKLVEIVLNQSNYGKIDKVVVSGGNLVEENGKIYARMGEYLSFAVTANVGQMHTGFVVNSIMRSNINYTHAISVEDINRGYINVEATFAIEEFGYVIEFTEGGNVKAGEKNISSGEKFSTNYFESITFVFWASERYKYTEIYLLINQTKTEISSNYIQFNANDNTYVITIPSNLFDVGGVNQVKITTEKIYWEDVRQGFEGDGTEPNPYVISNPSQFAQMSYFVNNNVSAGAGKVDYNMAHYIMLGSVDFGARFWKPIGTKDNPFSGTITLDYARHNIVLDGVYEKTQFGGLFGYITDSADIIVNKIEISTGIFIAGGVVIILVAIASVFVLSKKSKRKKMLERSRTLPNRFK